MNNSNSIYDVASTYWLKKEDTSIKMEDEMLYSMICNYVKKKNTCALATGGNNYLHVTPLEYAFHHDCFWIFSEGGLKFKGLKDSPFVCLTVFDEYTNFGNLHGLEVEGIASLIDLSSSEYEVALEEKKLSLDAIRKLSHPLYLIKIVPTSFTFLSSDFKELGYSTRQVWTKK